MFLLRLGACVGQALVCSLAESWGGGGGYEENLPPYSSKEYCGDVVPIFILRSIGVRRVSWWAVPPCATCRLLTRYTTAHFTAHEGTVPPLPPPLGNTSRMSWSVAHVVNPVHVRLKPSRSHDKSKTKRSLRCRTRCFADVSSTGRGYAFNRPSPSSSKS